MITSVFAPGRATAASKNGAHAKHSSMKKAPIKDPAHRKSRKRKILSDKSNEQDPDKTLVELDASTLSRAAGHRAYTTPIPSAKRRKLHDGEYLEVSPDSAAGNTTLVVTPDSVRDKGAFDSPSGISDKTTPWTELEKAWEGQQPVSASAMFPSDTMSQTSLGSFGFSLQRYSTTQSSGPFRKHVFSIAFEEEDDLDFDASTLPSQVTAAVRPGSPAKSAISSSRSPSPILLSPTKLHVSQTRPPTRLPISRLLMPARHLVVPSSQTQPMAPLSPSSQSNIVIPSSQTQPISLLSPASSRTTNNFIPSSQSQPILPLSPCSLSQALRLQRSPRTITKTFTLSSQPIENLNFLDATEMDAPPTLDKIIVPPVDQTHPPSSPTSKRTKATQSTSRHRTSSTSYYGDSVAFTLPPSMPGTSVVSGSSPERISEATSALLDSSIARKLFRTLETEPAELEDVLLDNALSKVRSPGVLSDRAAIEENAAAPGVVPTSTVSNENATMAFTMPPSIPTDTLAVDLADYLPLLDP
ncbi:hypothetical protein CALVIDRAFT_192077 [Calocera viscosa TUFC12733]|uniref:Uncharacterized protein n=1 Tax=Calocera viscosa (strain TUFC12733) TaxID=1330018 RepID=A0A167KP11_CALVF|nr:hypothetical protein CALVIDRAFT_192077 [Calocera viscosa TUFC12733]